MRWAGGEYRGWRGREIEAGSTAWNMLPEQLLVQLLCTMGSHYFCLVAIVRQKQAWLGMGPVFVVLTCQVGLPVHCRTATTIKAGLPTSTPSKSSTNTSEGAPAAGITRGIALLFSL